MTDALDRYAAKLAAAGLCEPGEPLFAAQDDRVRVNRASDPRRALAEAVLTGLGASALLLARPTGANQAAMLALARRALASGADRITPGDSETRTFLHDLPVLDGLTAEGVQNALARRKGCVIVHQGQALLAAAGSVSPEQCFVTASSMAFACFVGFFAGHLRALRAGTVTEEARAEFAALRPLLDQELARLPRTLPELATGPFADEGQARAAMIQAGRAVVEFGLVDSAFGNLSCRQATPSGELLLISQTGSCLDELAGCIDPCRMDGTSCVGLTASSEYSAHKAIYDAQSATRTILHGHPRFAVILSLDCERLDCEGAGQCHRSCAHARNLADAPDGPDVPIVPGEVGTGAFGLCNTLPPAIHGRRAAIVYGHGLFTTGGLDFRDAFQSLVDIEAFCRAEYFRRVAGLDAALPQRAGI